MRDNLVSIIARRGANGARTALVLAGAGVALLLLGALGHGSRRAGGQALVGLVLVVAVVAGGLAVEGELVGHVWPSLMPAVRP